MAVNLKRYLKDALSKEELDLLVRSYDVVGDMAIIIIPPELEEKELVIGKAILANNKNIRVVAKRDGLYGGEYRTIPLRIIAGENRKETEHKEYGVRLLVNPQAVYFSVRSGTERMRVASLVTSGEEVLVMFSGIGPYPLVISKNSEANEIIGVEKNPKAHEYAMKNYLLNKRLKNIRFIKGDVVEVLSSFHRTFDRIVMPLPKGGEAFLQYAVPLLRSGGVLHYYAMQHEDGFDKAVEKVELSCQNLGRKLLRAEVIKCGHCAPRTFRICVDALVE